MSRFRAVAWDIDGTLADSEPLHQRALCATCSALGVDLADLADDAFRGIHMFDVWDVLKARFPVSVTREAWLAAVERYYVGHAGEVAPNRGAVETVRALAARGVAQVCVSNSARAIVEANLDALGIRGSIAFSISFDDVTAGKPDPEPFRQAASRLDMPPPRIVAVEDSSAGALSARRAGLYVVNYAPNGLVVADCDRRIVDLAEIVALFGE